MGRRPKEKPSNWSIADAELASAGIPPLEDASEQDAKEENPRHGMPFMNDFDSYGYGILVALLSNSVVYRGHEDEDVIRMAIRLRERAAREGLAPAANDGAKS